MKQLLIRKFHELGLYEDTWGNEKGMRLEVGTEKRLLHPARIPPPFPPLPLPFPLSTIDPPFSCEAIKASLGEVLASDHHIT